MIKRLYSPRDSQEKEELKKELLNCWNKCVRQNKNAPNPDGYEALEMLYENYGHSQFMRIVIMTMRMQFDKQYIVKWESEQILPKRNCSGLKALVKNWKEQESKALNTDRGALFLEFLGSKNDLSKPEYIIGAIIGMVRRIRRGAKSDNNYLEITNGLLNLAQLKWEEYEYKVKKGVLPEPDYNVMPNENLNLLIRYQELLNIGKRGYPIERISGDNPPRTDLKRQLEEYVKDLGGADYFFTKDIFEWWAYRSLSRNSIRWMSPEDESKNFFKKRDEAIKGKKKEEKKKKAELVELCREKGLPTSGTKAELVARLAEAEAWGEKKKYIEELRGRGTTLKSFKKQSDDLIRYHKALAKFLNKPAGYVDKVKGKKAKNPSYAPELLLYRAISRQGKGLRKGTKLFRSISRRSVIRAKYHGKEETQDTSSVIGSLHSSISNVQMASNIVVAENHYLSVVMQVLLATDLMVRVRWFAGTRKSALDPVIRKIGKGTLDENENLVEAEIIQKMIVGTLGAIKRNLELVVPEANKSQQEGPVKLIEGWVAEVEQLKLEPKNTIKTDDGDEIVSGLGCLSHMCGGFVNWGWKKETGTAYGKKGRNKPQNEKFLELLYKSGNNENSLLISPDKGEPLDYGLESKFPYVIPLTSGSHS